MMESFSEGKWRLHSNYIDLYKGYELMYQTYIKHKERIFTLNYEKLVIDQSNVVSELESYLGIEIQKYHKNLNNIKLVGSMGDKIGSKQYNEISRKSINKWNYTICNYYRKYWVIKYLKWIGEDRLTDTGYDLQQIIDEVHNIKIGLKFLYSDIMRSGFGYCRRIFLIDIFKKHIFIVKNNTKRFILY
jgi:hypothetical protein